MQLIDFLKTADKGEYIYLGAASCFLWIAKPDEMIAKLPELDEEHAADLRHAIECKNRAIAFYEKHLASAQSEFEKKQLKRDLEKAQRIKNDFVAKLENRIPFAARQIKDLYRRRMVTPYGIVAIIEGNEMGDFWTFEEVEEYNGHS